MSRKYLIKCTEKIKDRVGNYINPGDNLPKLFMVDNITKYLYNLKRQGLIIIKVINEDIKNIAHLSTTITEDLYKHIPFNHTQKYSSRITGVSPIHIKIESENLPEKSSVIESTPTTELPVTELPVTELPIKSPVLISEISTEEKNIKMSKKESTTSKQYQKKDITKLLKNTIPNILKFAEDNPALAKKLYKEELKHSNKRKMLLKKLKVIIDK